MFTSARFKRNGFCICLGNVHMEPYLALGIFIKRSESCGPGMQCEVHTQNIMNIMSHVLLPMPVPPNLLLLFCM